MANIDSIELPASIVGLRDLRTCVKVLERLTSQLVNESIQIKAGIEDKTASPAALPEMLQELVTLSGMGVNSERQSEALKKQLLELVQHAPRIQLQFASEPDATMKRRLVAWLRSNIHRNLLIDIHVNPGVGGGFIVETTQRRYDFSWRTYLEHQSEHLTQKIREAAQAEAAHGK